MPLYQVIITAALVANILLALYILYSIIFKKVRNTAAIYYFLFAAFLSVHIYGDLLFQSAKTMPTAPEAAYGIIFYWVGFFAIACAFFLFGASFPRNKLLFFKNDFFKSSILLFMILLFPIGLSYITLKSRDFIQQIIIEPNGINHVVYGNLYNVAIGYLALFMGLGVAMVLLDYNKLTTKSEKNDVKIIFIGSLITLIFGWVGDVFLLRMFGFGELKLASIASLISCITMAYTVVGHKVFSINPVTEETVKEAPIFSVEEGKSYFIEEKGFPEKSLRFFADQTKHGKQGLVVSTIYPKQLRQKLGLRKTPIIWLTDSVSSDVENIKPNEIDTLGRSIRLFFEKATKPVLFFDGIKELVAENRAEKTVELLNTLATIVAETKGNIFFGLEAVELSFVETFNEIRSLRKSQNELEKKYLSRNLRVSQETYQQMLEENEVNLIEKETKLRIIEDELLGKQAGMSKAEREKAALNKTISVINFKIGKRMISPQTGMGLIKNAQKKLARLGVEEDMGGAKTIGEKL